MPDIQTADNRIYVKDEVVYGTDIVPDATNRIRTRDLDIKVYDGSREQLAYDGDGGRDRSSINTGPFRSLSCKIDFAGSGAKDVEPNYAVLLRACGADVVETALTDTVITLGGSNTIIDSVSCYFVEDLGTGMEKAALLGMRGGGSLEFARGSSPFFGFNMLGMYSTPSHDAVQIAGAPANQLKAIPMTNSNTIIATLDSLAVCVESLKFDNLGHDAEFVNAPNCLEVKSQPKQITGTIVIKDEGVATKNWVQMAESHNGVTALPLNMQHGTATGNILTTSSATIQFTDVQRTSLNGIKAFSLPFALVQGAPLVITQT